MVSGRLKIVHSAVLLVVLEWVAMGVESPVGARRVCLLISLLLILLVLGSFWRVPRLGFVFDDAQYIVSNPHLMSVPRLSDVMWAFTTTYASFWHPLVWLSYYADVVLFGQGTKGFHITNLLLHMANSVLLLILFWKLTDSVWRSAFVAALFAVHPLHVESVAWVSQRKDVLSTLFWILTMFAYIWYVEMKRRGMRPTLAAYCLMLFFFVLGLMAKPMLVTLPITLLLIDYWPLARFGKPLSQVGGFGNVKSHSEPVAAALNGCFRVCDALVEKIPLFVLSAISALIAYVAQEKAGAVSQAYSLGSRLCVSIVSCAAYIWKTAWPVRLCAHYPHPGNGLPWWEVTIAAVVLTSITFLVVRSRRALPYLTVGWFWYLITLTPVIGIIQVGTHAMADRYTYVPLLGLFIILAWGIPDLLSTRLSKVSASNNRVCDSSEHIMPVLPACGIVTILGFGIVSSFQTGYWRDNVTLFTRVLSVSPRNAAAMNNLGLELEKQGKPEEAIEFYAKALEVQPAYPYAMLNLGHALEGLGRLDEAALYYRRALVLKPNFAEALNNLGAILVKQRRPQEAITRFKQAIEVAPSYVDAYYNLAAAYVLCGNLSEAVRACERALALNPNDADAHSNLGSVLMRTGKKDEAIEHFRAAVRLEPKAPDAHYNLGVALSEVGDQQHAILEYQAALALDPDHFRSRINLGSLLLEKGQVDNAEKQFRLALKAKTDLPEAYAGLAAVCYLRGRYQEARQLVETCRRYGGEPNAGLVQALYSKSAR